MKLTKISVVLAVIVFTMGSVTAQKGNVVSAAMEFNKYMPALMQQKIDDAVKAMKKAKTFIDPAMQDASTKDDPKANFYNAAINWGLLEVSAMDSDDEELKVYQNDSIYDIIKNSVEKAYKNKRWRGETEDFFKMRISQAIMGAEMLFNTKKYDQAFAAFGAAYKIKDMIGEEEELDVMKTNSIISAQHYIDTLEKQGKYEEAMEFTSAALEFYPESEELAIAGVNLGLEQNNLEKAEEYFKFAAKANPQNKALFSNMGTIYLTAADKAYDEFSELDITDEGYQEKSDEMEALYAKAERNLEEALKIDPKYGEAAYNLGVLYLNRGEKLKTVAAQMDFNDPNYDKTLAKSQEMYKKAIVPLETFVELEPNNEGVLRVLFQVHRNAGNDEKALEYKRRADAIGH